MPSLKDRSSAVLATLALVAGSLFGLGSVALADTTLPDAPSGLSATIVDAAQGQVRLTWSAPANEQILYYQIFRYAGEGAPVTDEATYQGRVTVTDNPSPTLYLDQAPGEGLFQYAVIAVDDEGDLSQPSGWVTARVDRNGDGVITGDSTPPGVPQNLALGGAYANSLAITLTWEAGPDSADTARFLVYRAENGGSRHLLGYLPASQTRFDEGLTADGSYTYYVAAQDGSGNLSAPSAGASVTVDTLAPVAAISSPADGEAYTGEGELTVLYTISEEGAGYESGGVQILLDQAPLTTTTIDLSALAEGEHTVTVLVTDRAGNPGEVQVTFTVGAGSDGGGEDDQEDGKPGKAPDLLTLLTELRSEIAGGHYASLTAFARNGNLKAFRSHLGKFGNSRFISPHATEALLAALGDRSANPGKGSGKGRGRW